MSAAFKLPSLSAALAVLAAVAGISASPTVQAYVSRSLGSSTTSNVFKILAVLYALVNFKNLPGIWHVRVFRGMIYQIYFNKRPLSKPKHLFAPMITESTNTLMDCDYNFHKSNSTYFADLDVSRAHALGAVIRTGLDRLNKGDKDGLKEEDLQPEQSGKYMVALGAVSCFFLRQIDPLAKFEIYTRVLSWDRKWIYLISHIVKKGSIKPESYVMQPWKKSKRGSAEAKKEGEDLTKHIYATSISRYVFKRGRLTINPEVVLERSRLLPPRPAGVGLPPRSEASGSQTPVVSSDASKQEDISGPESIASVLTSKLDTAEAPSQTEDDEWTWEAMEAERLRGLKLASHFDALNDGHNELRAGEVLGKFGDYW